MREDNPQIQIQILICYVQRLKLMYYDFQYVLTYEATVLYTVKVKMVKSTSCLECQDGVINILW